MSRAEYSTGTSTPYAFRVFPDSSINNFVECANDTFLFVDYVLLGCRPAQGQHVVAGKKEVDRLVEPRQLGLWIHVAFCSEGNTRHAVLRVRVNLRDVALVAATVFELNVVVGKAKPPLPFTKGGTKFTILRFSRFTQCQEAAGTAA